MNHLTGRREQSHSIITRLVNYTGLSWPHYTIVLISPPIPAGAEEISIAGLHEIMNDKVVHSQLVFTIIILAIMLIIIFLWFGLYRWNNVRNMFRGGRGRALASAFAATIVYLSFINLLLGFKPRLFLQYRRYKS